MQFSQLSPEVATLFWRATISLLLFVGFLFWLRRPRTTKASATRLPLHEASTTRDEPATTALPGDKLAPVGPAVSPTTLADPSSAEGGAQGRYASHALGHGSAAELPSGYDDLVEFCVQGQTKAPPSSKLIFEVQIARYSPNRLGTLIKEGLAETVVTELKRGTDVALVFESDLLIPDSWLSGVRWRGEPVAPPFSVTAPTVTTASRAKNTIHIISGWSTPIGAIDFETIIDPGASVSSIVSRLASRLLRSDQLTNDATELVIDLQGSAAFRYRNAFISYARADGISMSYFAQGLEEARINVHADVKTFRLGETWHAQAERLIDQCDVFYLCWSAAASKSAAVLREVEYAQKRAKAHGHPKIIPMFIDDNVIALPQGLEEMNGLTVWSRIRQSMTRHS